MSQARSRLLTVTRHLHQGQGGTAGLQSDSCAAWDLRKVFGPLFGSDTEDSCVFAANGDVHTADGKVIANLGPIMGVLGPNGQVKYQDKLGPIFGVLGADGQFRSASGSNLGPVFGLLGTDGKIRNVNGQAQHLGPGSTKLTVNVLKDFGRLPAEPEDVVASAAADNFWKKGYLLAIGHSRLLPKTIGGDGDDDFQVVTYGKSGEYIRVGAAEQIFRDISIGVPVPQKVTDGGQVWKLKVNSDASVDYPLWHAPELQCSKVYQVFPKSELIQELDRPGSKIFKGEFKTLSLAELYKIGREMGVPRIMLIGCKAPLKDEVADEGDQRVSGVTSYVPGVGHVQAGLSYMKHGESTDLAQKSLSRANGVAVGVVAVCWVAVYSVYSNLRFSL